MSRLIQMLCIALTLIGCATPAPAYKWVQADGRTPDVTRFALDHTACKGTAERVLLVNETAYGTVLSTMRGCMADRGYLWVPERGTK